MSKILMPFQREGTDFLKRKQFALLADEQGLGKTVTALAAVKELNLRRVAVVCPASVRSNWKQEIKECGLSLSNFIVESYNCVSDGRFPPFPGGKPDGFILDEVHFLKTPKSKRTQAVFGNDAGLVRMGVKEARIWGLTGTPVLNRPRELYPMLKTLAEGSLKPYESWERFTQRFCGAFWDGHGINTKGASNIDDLSRRLSSFMLRREKKDVLPQLPPRIYSRPPLELTEDEYESIYKVETEIQNREVYLSSSKERFSQLGDTARMRRATGEAKVRAVSEFIDDLLDGDDTEKTKTVVFAWHRSVIKSLYERLGHYDPVIYAGGMNDGQKQAAIRRFMADKDCRIFIGQISAAGTGINGLQKASNSVVFAELEWVPGNMAQAVDRVHRIGQAAPVVNVYLPHVEGTIESAMLSVQDAKNEVISRLVRPVGMVVSDEELLEGLL